MKKQHDWLNEGNARVLACQIKEFWAQHGYHVTTWVEPVFSTAEDRRAYGDASGTQFAVRSNLVNGLPRGFAWKEVA